MKNVKRIVILNVVLLSFGVSGGFVFAENIQPAEAGDVVSNKAGCNKTTGLAPILAAMPQQEIASMEREGLVRMREEEKLARDVYRFLGDYWQLPVFNNIVRSEQKHMDMVKVILDKYKIADPVSDDTPGLFVDSEMKSLYAFLTTKGKKSKVDALQVGMIVEDLDIKDLENELAKTDNDDIRMVYQNLLKGSRNHMRAFMGQLTLNKGAYEAKYLTQEKIDKIITSAMERGPVDAKGEPLPFNGTAKK